MTDTPQVLLAHHLKALKLPTFLREYDKVARQCAAEGVDHVRFLLRLVELEVIERERRMVDRRIKAAKFPTVKSLDSFGFAALPSCWSDRCHSRSTVEIRSSFVGKFVGRPASLQVSHGNDEIFPTHILPLAPP